MADLTYRVDNRSLAGSSRMSWGAIFAGAFGFLAVWTTFGALGLAIFGNAGNVTGGMTAAESLWFVVLSVVSLYVGGFIAGRTSSSATRAAGRMHGFISFGLSIVAALLLVGITMSANTAAAVANTHSGLIPASVANSGYAIFAATLLGAIAAMWGGWQSIPGTAGRTTAEEQREIRRVA